MMMILTFLLAVVIMAAGFAILHFALKHRTMELRVCGWTLVIGAVLAFIGMCYFPMQPAPQYGPGYWGDSGRQCHMFGHKKDRMRKQAIEQGE